MLSVQDFSQIHQIVRDIVQEIVQKEISASEQRVLHTTKLMFRKERAHTRKTLNEIISYFDKRVTLSEHRLNRIDHHLGFPELSL